MIAGAETVFVASTKVWGRKTNAQKVWTCGNVSAVKTSAIFVRWFYESSKYTRNIGIGQFIECYQCFDAAPKGVQSSKYVRNSADCITVSYGRHKYAQCVHYFKSIRLRSIHPNRFELTEFRFASIGAMLERVCCILFKSKASTAQANWRDWFNARTAAKVPRWPIQNVYANTRSDRIK